MRLLHLLSPVFLFLSSLSYSQHNLIPAPVSYAAKPGSFVLDSRVGLEAAAPELAELTKWFSGRLMRSNISIGTKNPAAQNNISIALNPKAVAALGREGYTLEVSANKITIMANAPAGLFYGLQSLLQLLPPDFESAAAMPASFAIPCCTITDYPRFGWRGLMLDVSRNFFTPAEVKQYIDVMASYKLNVLHWHLTDDNGWRIQIKSLPKLTETGACRVKRYGTFGERIAPKPGELADDCGFYTQEDVKAIVKYAAQKNITIVPEIDVPGHSLAAIAAYPELSITKVPAQVSPGHSFSEWYPDGTFKMLLDNTLNPADEAVYTFLDKVFTEVAALFPGQYIHAGGDECYHGYWEKSAECQQLMKEKNIKDVHGLQSYFMTRVSKIIQSKGKSMIGWDEILDGGLAPGAAVMSWRGMKGGIAAAKLGHPVVMTPTNFAYLDYMQADATLEPRIYEKLYLKTSYAFEPVPDSVDASLILGGQGNLWTEKVPTLDHAFYMTYPRALALSEVLWSPKAQRNWPDFAGRTETHFQRFDNAGISICKALYDPWAKPVKKDGTVTIELGCDHPQALLYYTIDETFPTLRSTRYTGAFTLPEGPVKLKVASFINGKPAGRLLKLTREELLLRK